MTVEEQSQQHRVAEAAKAAWVSGFQSARHWPNHSIPDLTVEWEGSTPRVVPNWNTRKPGWLG